MGVTIERDARGWSLLFNGYALFKGLSLEGAELWRAVYVGNTKKRD